MVSVYKQELKKKILDYAMAQFMVRGIKSITMDALARDLKISKRTMYEIFNDKEELLLEGVKALDNDMHTKMLAFYEEGDHNVIDILVKLYHEEMDRSQKASPAFIHDLHKYARLKAYFDDRARQNDDRAKVFFDRGVAEGYFRADIDYHLVSVIGRITMDEIISNELYRKYPTDVLFHNFTFVIIRGLCTLKGMEALDRRLQ